MGSNDPRHNHYAPRFYLRVFASDEQRAKVPTVTKHGDRAIWRMSSVEYVGAAGDLYSLDIRGAPNSVEGNINRKIETPISESRTWEKISTGQSERLTIEDMPTIYAMMRHLEFRTPHAKRTMEELIEMCAANPDRFSTEEQEMYGALRKDAQLRALFFAHQASSLDWVWEAYSQARLTICRTNETLRTSTVPAHVVRAPDHPALHLPLPGQIPHMMTMTLNQHSFACLVFGEFDGAKFENIAVEADVARGYNRHRVAQFAHFETNQHLITGPAELEEDMAWAGYEIELARPDKISFRRRKLE